MLKSHTRVLFTLLAVASVLPITAAPARRRAVRVPSAQTEFVILEGIVTDADTGQPVLGAEVVGGGRIGQTNAEGKYQMQLVAGASTALFVRRTGYVSSPSRDVIPSAAGPAVNFTIKSKPTITVRDNAGTTRVLSGDSAEWAYELVFTGYVRTKEAKFCKSDGSSVTLNVTDVARITGPVVSATSSCCNVGQLTGVTMTLKSGETSQLFFQDSCFGYPVVFVARDHATAQFVFIKYSDIAEIVLP